MLHLVGGSDVAIDYESLRVWGSRCGSNCFCCSRLPNDSPQRPTVPPNGASRKSTSAGPAACGRKSTNRIYERRLFGKDSVFVASDDQRRAGECLDGSDIRTRIGARLVVSESKTKRTASELRCVRCLHLLHPCSATRVSVAWAVSTRPPNSQLPVL